MFLFVSRRVCALLATTRTLGRATELTCGWKLLNVQKNTTLVSDWIKKLAVKKIGVEPSLNKAQFDRLAKKLRPAKHVTCPLVRKVRAIKSPFEIQCLTRAQREAEKNFQRMLGEIKPGMTEHQVHNRFLQMIYENDALEGPSFLPIVASGSSAWTTHSFYTKRKLRKNDCVILDFGVRYKGYCSDMTRTIFVGKPTQKMRDVYSYVLEAQQNCIAKIQDGIPGRDIYNIAKETLARHGYPFLHGLGHGVGLEVHDDPLPGLNATNKQPLQSGMVVTVEPGIYIENEFGVRIEDVLVVTETGCKNLMRTSRDAIVI